MISIDETRPCTGRTENRDQEIAGDGSAQHARAGDVTGVDAEGEARRQAKERDDAA